MDTTGGRVGYMWVWIEKSVSYGDDDGVSRFANSGNAINGFLKLCAIELGLGLDEVCANLTDDEDDDDAEGAPYCDSTNTVGFLGLPDDDAEGAPYCVSTNTDGFFGLPDDGGDELKDGRILIVALSLVGGS